MYFDLNKLKNDGFVEFNGNLIGDDSLDIANNLGKVENIPGVDLVQTLVPSNNINNEASSYSGIYGFEEFPFHSDMAHWYRPPRFLMLRCLTASQFVSTKIIKAAPLFENEDPNDLRRALFRPRRRLDGHLSPLRLFEGDFYRWDYLFIEPIGKLAKSLQARIEQRIAIATPNIHILAHAGDCLIIDNWQAFHARSTIPAAASNRKLERVYLSEFTG
ncbi:MULTISPECIES: TauD/TfdA family dioxygenase [Methylomonas]|uniref:TauD/TfdA-like domain-containing protein n=1 Tax=Methylomonas koyamae TaxID=702114 RepID=A0A177NP18_9GAMM|nr:TauD/TfdA family dioxygenase [Methylomonas koyamae]OAI19828.1 hypothetical protein A1355_03585 [Methylomonas koyamae]